MTKNITVIDENENISGSTYPKRAEGLVKKGRARWIDDNVIRLCAPRKKEETKMDINEVLDNQLTKLQEQLRDENAAENASVRIKILETLSDFRKCDERAKNAEMINERLSAMQETLNACVPNDSSTREVTYQKMLDLMSMLIDTGNVTESTIIKKQQNNYFKNEENSEKSAD